MTLRLRLTVLCVGLVAVVLTAFSVATYLIASARIYGSLDDSLSAEANAVVANLPEGELGRELPEDARTDLEAQAASGTMFEVRDSTGNTIFSSLRGLSDLLPPGDVPRARTFLKAKVAQRELRVLYVPLVAAGGTAGTVAVGQSMQESNEALSGMLWTLGAGSIFALFLTFLPAYFLAGGALRPIKDVSRVARRIERTSDFSQRLRERQTSDEIGELIITFNEMIERVALTLAAHNEFLAESSHELRRPLTTLRTNLDILHDAQLPNADRTACVDRMTQEARAMTSLVDDLLLLTRDKTQALNRSLVNFSELSTDEVFRAQLSEPRASITSVVEPDLMVRGDVERLHQVLRNLLENAVNYTPHGKINVLVAVGDGVATLVVRDSGIGIPEVDLPKVFDRFFRSEEARSVRREGVGLGLAIVKYVIEAHGGSVSASSESEGGAVFTVSLPLAEAPPRLLADIRQVS